MNGVKKVHYHMKKVASKIGQHIKKVVEKIKERREKSKERRRNFFKNLFGRRSRRRRRVLFQQDLIANTLMNPVQTAIGNAT